MIERATQIIGVALLLLSGTSPAVAGPSDFDPAGKSPDQIFEHFGLGDGEGCLQFVDPVAVDYRKEQWLRAIEAVWRQDPDYVLEWLVGAETPPARVRAESEKQRDCLVARIIFDAGEEKSPLVVDWQQSSARKAQMPDVARRFEQNHAFARRMIATITESAYRNSHTQSWIWKRKYVFSGRNFNVVSAKAADRCSLEAGSTWKPDSWSHRTCWHDTLAPEEREHEILQASAAPGISRHHWGTDFDLFGLNPRSFRDRGRNADEYKWMRTHAIEFGFFQPYASNDTSNGHRYMEERWHWSYYPVGQALLEFARSHEDEVGAALNAQWDAFEERWSGGASPRRPFFTFVRKHWREFMFNVDDVAIRSRPDAPR